MDGLETQVDHRLSIQGGIHLNAVTLLIQANAVCRLAMITAVIAADKKRANVIVLPKDSVAQHRKRVIPIAGRSQTINEIKAPAVLADFSRQIDSHSLYPFSPSGCVGDHAVKSNR